VGRPPFEVDDEGETRNKIMHENTLKFPPHVSADCINFIKSALAKTAGQQRINASESRCCVEAASGALLVVQPAGASWEMPNAGGISCLAVMAVRVLVWCCFWIRRPAPNSK